jgi:X-Pro dipeptidyl-peptidase
VGGAGLEQPFHREVRHLGVVGDQAGFATPRRDIWGNALRPVLPADLPQRLDLDRRPERVADRAAEEAASYSIPYVHEEILSGSRRSERLRVIRPTSRRSRVPQLRPALFAVTLTLAIATPAQAAAAPAITVQNGRTQPVFSYADAVREHVYVESTVDSDLDGKLDKVRVDIIRPKESGPGLKVPVIIDESPYYDNSGRGNEAERKIYDAAGSITKFPLFYDNYFVPRGYAVLNVDMLGTTRSDGCPDIGGKADVLGGKAVIDWLNGRAKAFRADGTPAVADWTTGKAAMIGKSYDGTLANAVAATGVEGLKTIVPISAISSWYKYQRSNGVIYNHDYASWLANYVDTDPEAKCQAVRDRMDAEDGDDTGDYNPFWAERDYIKGLLADASMFIASVFFFHKLNELYVKPYNFSTWW